VARSGPCALPEFYPEYFAGNLIQADKLQALKKDHDVVISTVKELFHDSVRVTLKLLPPSEGQSQVAPFDKEKGPIRIAHGAQLAVFLKGKNAGEPPRYTCDAAVIVESDPGPVTTARRPTWRVVGVQLIRGGEHRADAGPGGPGAGPSAGGR
jgi:hypothetical protein